MIIDGSVQSSLSNPGRRQRLAWRWRRVARRVAAHLPPRWVWRVRGRPGAPPVGAVDLGDLRHVSPVSRFYGFDRGLPVDRHYIEAFLTRHAGDVRGRVLEVGGDAYTRRFGGGAVCTSDILDVNEANPRATLVADIAADGLPAAAFDCIVITQTLQFVYDVHAAIGNLASMLARGGVLLATVPGISQLEATGWSWTFTPYSVRRLLAEAFPAERIAVEAYGSALTATAFLNGLAHHELTADELTRHDPAYPIVITARAVRA